MSDSEFTNWSGGLQFSPGEYVRPRSEDEIVDLVRSAAKRKATLRPVGAGHSSTPLVETVDTLVSLDRMSGLIEADSAGNRATLLPGTPLKTVTELLAEHRLSMENLGDVDSQFLAGAFSTGTHGSGRRFGGLSTQLAGFRMVDGTGQVIEVTPEQPSDLLQRAGVSLGALGIFTQLTLRLVPLREAVRREWCMHIEECLALLEHLIEENRNFDFYWYPRRDEAKLRTHNYIDEDPGVPPGASRLEEERGWLPDLLTSDRHLKFHEMEYYLPADAGVACFEEVRERVKAHHRQHVGWRVLVRMIASDEIWLSPAYRRDSMTVSIHQNASLPYMDYFNDIEPIFQRYGGRPHWGKVHSMRGEGLRRLYPHWDDFREYRRERDPEGVFLNRHLEELFEP